MWFDYDYFCGANVVVEIDGMEVLEAAGITYQLNDSKMPLYGYSSRHFDAVAQGQVLVQGALIINYIHNDYLFRLIQVAKGELSGARIAGSPDPLAQSQVGDALISELDDPQINEELRRTMIQDLEKAQAIADMFKQAYWEQTQSSRVTLRTGVSPHDRFDSVDIKITFGERSEANSYLGNTNVLLSDVFFTGRGSRIQIDENVIVEEYPFFARNIHTFTAKPPGIVTVNETETETEYQIE